MHKNGISSGVGGATHRRCAGCAVPLVGTSASVTPSSSGQWSPWSLFKVGRLGEIISGTVGTGGHRHRHHGTGHQAHHSPRPPPHHHRFRLHTLRGPGSDGSDSMMDLNNSFEALTCEEKWHLFLRKYLFFAPLSCSFI